MSRFALHLRLAAIGALGAAALVGVARADTVPPASEACSAVSPRTVATCHPAQRTARRSMPRTGVTRPLLADLGAFPAGPYAGLLILGIGF